MQEMLSLLLPVETVENVSTLIFSTFDKDNSGSLNFVEFVTSIHCMSTSSPEVRRYTCCCNLQYLTSLFAPQCSTVPGQAALGVPAVRLGRVRRDLPDRDGDAVRVPLPDRGPGQAHRRGESRGRVRQPRRQRGRGHLGGGVRQGLSAGGVCHV